MNRIAFAIGATLGAAVIATTAMAHEMDTDQDGLYSLPELQVEYTDLTQEQYTAIDSNSDGAVDADELAAAVENGTLPALD